MYPILVIFEFCLEFVFPTLFFFAPGKGAKYGRFWADCFFSGRPAAWFNSVLQNKGMVLAIKNGEEIEKKHRKRDRTPVRARTNIADQTCGTEEVWFSSVQ